MLMDISFHKRSTSGAITISLGPPTPEGETALQYRAEPPPTLSGHPRPRGKQRSNTERSHHHLSQATHARGGNSAPIQSGATTISLRPPTPEGETALQYRGEICTKSTR